VGTIVVAEDALGAMDLEASVLLGGIELLLGYTAGAELGEATGEEVVGIVSVPLLDG
jgi:hypothetical protein